MKDRAVKVDAELLKKVDNFIKQDKFKYNSKKQVINLAIIDFLKLNGFNKVKTKRRK